jgi:hypothetical protein
LPDHHWRSAARLSIEKDELMSQAPTLSPIEEVVTFLAGAPSRDAIAAFRLSDAARDRLSDLLRRNQAGLATPPEARELDQMILLDDIIALVRARAQSPDSHATAATWPTA